MTSTGVCDHCHPNTHQCHRAPTPTSRGTLPRSRLLALPIRSWHGCDSCRACFHHPRASLASPMHLVLAILAHLEYMLDSHFRPHLHHLNSTHSLAHTLTHSPTHPLTHSPTHPLTHTHARLTRTLAHSLVHSLTRSLAHSFTHSRTHTCIARPLRAHGHARSSLDSHARSERVCLAAPVGEAVFLLRPLVCLWRPLLLLPPAPLRAMGLWWFAAVPWQA